MKLITRHEPQFINFTAYRLEDKGRCQHVQVQDGIVIYWNMYFGIGHGFAATTPRKKYGRIISVTDKEIEFEKISKKEAEKYIS